jgi:hypothetical protein
MARKHKGNKNVDAVLPQIGHEAIAQLAKQIWEQEGCQAGRDLDYWLRAEQVLRPSSASTTSETNGRAGAATRGT